MSLTPERRAETDAGENACDANANAMFDQMSYCKTQEMLLEPRAHTLGGDDSG